MKKFKKGSKNEKIGTYGEDLVRRTLKQRGKVTTFYLPEDNTPHKFEGLALTIDDNPFFFEIKTKPSLNMFPATGFDKNQWHYYKQFNAILPFYVYFVDSKLGGIYYATLNTLNSNIFTHNKLPKDIVFFNNKCLTLLRRLQPTELSNLKRLEHER